MLFGKISKLKIKTNFIPTTLRYAIMQSKTQFTPVPEHVNFAKEEEIILKYWNDIDAFKQQLEKTKHLKPYTFYDGPPFATGLPHYGHICAGTIKDVVTRYASQTGHFVERRFGWDCHGLPIEYEIDKEYGIKTKDDVFKIGIAEYNKRCKSIVMRYSTEWRTIVSRLGRWIDFDNDYKTMDLKFMESVWWVFKQMWDKGLVYRGAKVMPYSNGCATVLSNFEAGQNYKDVQDPSVYITFPLMKEPEVKLVAWTTTPWTLPSNLALAVNPDFDYVKLKDKKTGEIYIIAKLRILDLYKKPKEEIQIIEEFKGKTLEGLEYIPLFDYFENRRANGCFKVLVGDFVTSDTGTGVVHMAPAFGDDDYKICCRYGIIKPDSPPCPLDENGRFTSTVSDFKGLYIKDKECERGIIKYLKEKKRLIHETQFTHSYPFCWRSETPLIYKAVNSWFIKVTAIKQQLLVNNRKAYWVPTYAQEGRFHNWLEDAQDWCFSRNRFWGNPIPIWVSEDFEEQICVASVKELMELSGIQNIDDIHRESIDHIKIPSKQGKGVLRRIDEVFDCWFESGSMPFAQVHYPFSINDAEFSKRFPADFIGEGLDQTRGWFYTLNVIATAVKNENPYKNLIVNGLVLASDGKKMSKRLKNYPDPKEVIDELGADAIRLYLINSPLVRAETLNFKKEGVFGVIRDIFLPWYNVYRFLIQNIGRWESKTEKKFVFDSSQIESQKLTNIMDRWILAANQNLLKAFKHEMQHYRLYTIVPKLLKFLEVLTNWYVRLNRPRLKGEISEEDQLISLNTLYEVLFNSSLLMSPFTPFVSEMIYQNLRKVLPEKSNLNEDSIHFLQMPQFKQELIDENIERDVELMQKIIEISRLIRERKKISLKQPITSLTILTENQDIINRLKPLVVYIEDEMNVAEVLFETQVSNYTKYQITPNHKALGAKLKKAYNDAFRTKLTQLNSDEVNKFIKEGVIEINGEKLTNEHLSIQMSYKKDNLPDYLDIDGDGNIAVLLDLRQNENLKQIGTAREIINRIQKLRKKVGFSVDDDIFIFIKPGKDSKQIEDCIQHQSQLIQNTLKKPFLPYVKFAQNFKVVANESHIFENEAYEIVITPANLILNLHSINEKYGQSTQDIAKVISCLDYHSVKGTIKQHGHFTFKLENNEVVLKLNEDIFIY